MWLEAHLKPAFQPRMPLELPKTFQMLLEDSGSEDPATYKFTENAYAYYRQDATLLTQVSFSSVFQGSKLYFIRKSCVGLT